MPIFIHQSQPQHESRDLGARPTMDRRCQVSIPGCRAALGLLAGAEHLALLHLLFFCSSLSSSSSPLSSLPCSLVSGRLSGPALPVLPGTSYFAFSSQCVQLILTQLNMPVTQSPCVHPSPGPFHLTCTMETVVASSQRPR
jgi:hypothetical protein